MNRPFRDRVWNLAPFQPTAVQELPRTRAGRGTGPSAGGGSTLQPQKHEKKHGEPLRRGAHFLWPHGRSALRSWSYLQETRSRSRERQIASRKGTKTKKNPKTGAVDQRGLSLHPIPCRPAGRGCGVEKKSVLLKLAHSCGETFRCCCCCCWGNLCCAGSPQRSVSAQ